MGELVVRWMQFSIFTSITRMHGSRIPKEPDWAPLSLQCDPTAAAGGPVEPWAYGPAEMHTEDHVKSALALKQSLKPYLMAQLQELSEHGQPLMRPLWYDFADDVNRVGDVPDQFMWGPEYMVAPVLEVNATARQVRARASI
jgi:alpha-D-xyloside xylohydrolase